MDCLSIFQVFFVKNVPYCFNGMDTIKVFVFCMFSSVNVYFYVLYECMYFMYICIKKLVSTLLHVQYLYYKQLSISTFLKVIMFIFFNMYFFTFSHEYFM